MTDAPAPVRKIIHVDMDAFFASVEQRDRPELRGKPVAVGGSKARGVVAAASYEARAFGVRSAMPSVTAARLCPDLTFVKSRFDVYREVSGQIRAIFQRYTDLIEPLSLDEAFLDVSHQDRPATAIAQEIRAAIRTETELTASAGVSYNKFIAKVASDQNKPDGICVVRPGEGAAFVAALPIRRFRGVGPVMAKKMERLGIQTGADLAAKPMAFLQEVFGKSAGYYYSAARGIDDRPVRSSRVRKSIGAERTFSEDLQAEDELMAALARIEDAVWERIEKHEAAGRTVTLKVKFADFQQITRAASFAVPVADREAFVAAGRALLRRELPVPKGVRLLGLTLSALSARGDEAGEGTGGRQMDLGI
ncbi:MAG: DNA polymerase IV [Pacificimonas sp.]|jgi:DNA polymerase-4|nr:DNA polymerase IV [Pacificimonas sp.]